MKNVLLYAGTILLSIVLSIKGFSQGCSFEASIIPTHIKCNGMATGKATVVESPAGTYTYLWSTGATVNSIENLIAETYFVKITDNTGCEIVEFVTITQPPKLVIEDSLSHPICYNENSGAIYINTSGGAAPYTYIWSNNVETESNLNLYKGDYSSTVTDANFCQEQNTYTLTQPDAIATVAEIEEVRGYGLSDGSINISCFGGVFPYSYAWSNEKGFTAASEDIYNIISATYDLVITDSKNCTYDTSIFVYEPPLLGYTAKITNVFCNAFSDGVIDISAFGGVQPYTYTWANTEKILESKTKIIEDLAMGSYYLTLTDDNGIFLTDSLYVDEPQTIVANIISTDAYCFDSLNGNAFLTVSGGVTPFSFLWSNGSSTQNIENVHAGFYDVEIVDSNGCFRRVETTINQPDSIEINTSAVHLSCKDHYNGKIFTDVEGGIPPYQYEWSNGLTTQKIEMLEVGMYSVTIIDDHDCPMTEQVEITVPINGCIAIPNAFTPNGDGLNDVWDIQNYYLYPDIDVMVFNKEGYLVFHDTGYENAWDGTFNDNGVAPGTYYYIINLNNGDPTYKGIVTILR